MKKSIILYIIAAAILAAAIYKITRDRKKKHTIKASSTQIIFPAEGYLVRDTLVHHELNTIGNIRANENVDIVSEISKRLVSINFMEGTFVSKGRLLFKLDDADLKARLEKLTIMEALASENEQRSKTLYEKEGVSQAEYDEVRNRLLTIRADIHLIEVELDKTEIKAPFSGRIGLRNVSEGAFITPDMILTSLHDVSWVKIDLSVPERYANSIECDEQIDFTIQANPQVFTATIKAIEPCIDMGTRNIQVMAIADNKEGLLIPGASIKVVLEFEETERSIYVPSQCLIPSLKGYNIYKVKKGKVLIKQVSTGSRTNECVQLLDGAEIGDTLIMTNVLRIRPGSSVKIIKVN